MVPQRRVDLKPFLFKTRFWADLIRSLLRSQVRPLSLKNRILENRDFAAKAFESKALSKFSNELDIIKYLAPKVCELGLTISKISLWSQNVSIFKEFCTCNAFSNWNPFLPRFAPLDDTGASIDPQFSDDEWAAVFCVINCLHYECNTSANSYDWHFLALEWCLMLVSILSVKPWQDYVSHLNIDDFFKESLICTHPKQRCL